MDAKEETKLREMLRREDFSHVSYRSWCGTNFLYAYRRDAASPSGVLLIEGVVDTARAREIVAEETGRGPQAGGQMGQG